jgi:hypothetical protein
VIHVVSADIETAVKPVNVAGNAFIPADGLTMAEEERKLVRSGVASKKIYLYSSPDTAHYIC